MTFNPFALIMGYCTILVSEKSETFEIGERTPKCRGCTLCVRSEMESKAVVTLRTFVVSAAKNAQDLSVVVKFNV